MCSLLVLRAWLVCLWLWPLPGWRGALRLYSYHVARTGARSPVAGSSQGTSVMRRYALSL